MLASPLRGRVASVTMWTSRPHKLRPQSSQGRGMVIGGRAYNFARVTVGVLGVVVLAACGTMTRNPVPESAKLNEVVAAPGPGLVRFWGDAVPKDVVAFARRRDAEFRAEGINPSGVRNYLALSGGGSDGAFGAGLLVGWSAAGTRPKFDLVTGVSTGSLIAPFAFLGSSHDGELKEVFTTYGLNDIARRRPLVAIAVEASIADDAPLAHLIEQYVTPDFVAAIAGEYRKGRLPLIGTTNLDAQRPVIWNMGEIAAKGDQDSIELFRKVIRASASIPGIFPPVLVSVEQDGKMYDEMHVDGGVAAQVFIFPTRFDPRTVDKQLG